MPHFLPHYSESNVSQDEKNSSETPEASWQLITRSREKDKNKHLLAINAIFHIFRFLLPPPSEKHILIARAPGKA